MAAGLDPVTVAGIGRSMALGRAKVKQGAATLRRRLEQSAHHRDEGGRRFLLKLRSLTIQLRTRTARAPEANTQW